MDESSARKRTVEDQSVETYERIASDYDQHLNAMPGDRWVRQAFYQFVLDRVQPPAKLLDFGCGTGIDAQWYADRGFNVWAYDNSPSMVRVFHTRCADHIAQRHVQVAALAYADILCAMRSGPKPDAITANFGVLNHIPDLAELFACFRDTLAPQGVVFVSMLNPIHWKDLLRIRWWLNSRFDLQKRLVTETASTSAITRYLMSAVTMASRPYLRKVNQASAGAFIRYHSKADSWSDPRALGARIERKTWRWWPTNTLGRYTFLAFQHRDQASG